MNNNSEENNKKQEPQISLELGDSVIQLSLSALNEILEREITNFLLSCETNKDIININELKTNIAFWKSKCLKLEAEVKVLENIVKRLENDLKIDEFAQPYKCMNTSIGQNVKISKSDKLNTANVHKNSYNKQDILTISNSEDEKM